MSKGLIDKVRHTTTAGNARDAYVAERLEIATYAMLEHLAVHAGDRATVEVARRNLADEQKMAKAIASRWERAVHVSLPRARSRRRHAPVGGFESYGPLLDPHRGAPWGHKELDEIRRGRRSSGAHRAPTARHRQNRAQILCAACKTGGMPPNLRDVTRDFAGAAASLEALRAAARAERVDRQLADAILKLIAEWESGAWTGSARARNELRARAKQLVPPAPPESTSRKDPGATMYEAGLRGQWRRD